MAAVAIETYGLPICLQQQRRLVLLAFLLLPYSFCLLLLYSVLQREPVRYITNTSTGNRGAGLCEQFLRLGYYVIFLTSVRAVKPFVRHLMPSHPMPHILDFLSLEGYQQQQEEEQEQTTSLADEHIEPVASEGEVSVPPASATSRRLAGQASGMGPEAAPVEALGSVLSSSSSLAGEENREEGTPAGEPVASAAGDPSSGGRWDGTPEEGSRWRVIFREPRKRGEEESHEGALEQIDALGWELNTGEAAAALEVHRQCRNRLLCLSYQTLVEYSFLVRAIVAGAAPLRERLMFCSAAAVADFYVPHALMPHHKLRAPQQQEGAPQYAPAGSELLEGPTREMGSVEVQGPSRSVSSMEGSHPKRWFAESFLTGEGPKGTSEAASAGSTTVTSDQQHHLTLRLHLVPKMLLMVRAVAPSCFLVVFKLETDETKLEKSALSYLGRGGGQGVADCVIGNTMQTRRLEAMLFTRDGQKEVKYKQKPHPAYLGVRHTRAGTFQLRTRHS